MQDGFQSSRGRSHDAHDEAIQIEARFTPAGDYHTRDNRDQSGVHQPGFPSERHQVRKHGCEEGRGGTDGLVEGDGQEAEGDVATHNGRAEDYTKCQNFEELRA